MPVAVHPILELAERLPAKRVEPTLGVLPDVDEARFVQKTQLLGDAWLVDVDLVHELAHGALALAERADEPPAGRIRQHLEDVSHGDVYIAH